MAEHPPVQRASQVRAQKVLANLQAAPQSPLLFLPAPQGPQVAVAAPTQEAAAKNAVAGNQNPGLPLVLEVNFGFVFSFSLGL